MNGNGSEKALVSRKMLDFLFIIQIMLNIVVLGVIISILVWVSFRVSDINQRQIESIQQQNDAQLCAQHDIVIAVRGIGLKLGLPVEDIVPPNVEGLNCETK